MSDVIELTLTNVANEALVVGMDLGFNAAEIECFCDPQTADLTYTALFGDRQQMCAPRLRAPCAYALSYTEEAPCTREPRLFALPSEMLSAPAKELRTFFTERLLETV